MVSSTPWRVVRCACGHPTCNRHGTDNGVFYQGSGYSLDDARLIAAAPDLLAVLEALEGSFEKHRPKAMWDAARAAIAKARGL